jgi:hypothetical protein
MDPSVPNLSAQDWFNLLNSQQQQIAELQQLLQTSINTPRIQASTHQDVRIPLPETFNGSRQQVRGFLNQIRLLISQRPHTYDTDTKCVALVGSLLKGDALVWFSPIFERNDPALANFESFVTLLRGRFDDPNRQRTAAARLQTIRQGKRPATSYATEFQLLLADAGWDDAAARHIFQAGLNDPVKDLLLSMPESTNLTTLITHAISCDERLFQRRMEQQAPFRSNYQPPNTSGQGGSGPYSQPTPMQLDTVMTGGRYSPRLHPSERHRRLQEGLCLYCAEKGHVIANCPLTRRRDHTRSNPAEAPSPSTNKQAGSPYSYSHTPPIIGSCSLGRHRDSLEDIGSPVILDIIIDHEDRQLPARALLDSGAAANFIDRSFAISHGVHLQLLDRPIPVEAIDGRLISQVKEFACITVNSARIDASSFSGKFFVIDSPRYPIILGITWLRAVNPPINWRSHKVTDCTTRKEPADLCASLEIKGGEPSLPPSYYKEFNAVFEKRQADLLPEHRSYDCYIELTANADSYPKRRIYSLSIKEEQVLREYIHDMLNKGFIRHSSSPLGAPVLFTKKKDGGLRPCIDYRGLNSITKKVPYPIPVIRDILQQLRTAKVFTKLDLRGAYNLLRIKAGDEWKTAFSCKYGHFEYRVMPFGLMNAPSFFQYFMHDLFRDYTDLFLVVYLDDLLIYSDNPLQHKQHVKLVLQRLMEHGLAVKPEKCSFHTEQVEFLGYIVTPKGCHMDPTKVQTILDWQAPKDIVGVQRFLGFANFYRDFITNYSQIASPLTRLTRKDTAFTWGEAELLAFQTLKKNFQTAPLLTHFDPKKPIVVEADASDFAMGMVISQPGESDNLHPIAFYSRKFTVAELNYDIHDKELLAVVTAFKQWRHYLEGTPECITVFSDHKNLVHFTKSTTLSRRQVRWSQTLSQYNFQIIHRPGALSGVPDALSRRPEYEIQANDPSWSLQQQAVLKESQLIPPIVSAFLGDADPHDDVLDHKHRHVLTTDEQKLKALQLCHDSETAGHPGVRKTLELLQRQYSWPGLRSYVQGYINSCDTCKRCKVPRHKSYGFLLPLPLPDGLWRSISMDLIVKLPVSQNFNSILVVVDRYSKMSHFIPCREECTAEDIANLFLSNIFRLHGLPDEIITDRGPQFIAKFWSQLFYRLKVNCNRSSSRHPQSDGQTERVNQCLEQYLRCHVDFLQDNWVDLLPLAEFAYNNSVHSAIKMSPFYANSGFHPQVYDIRPAAGNRPCPTADERAEHLQNIRKYLEQSLQQARQSMSKWADKNREAAPIFKAGDLAWLRRGNIPTNRPCTKLDYVFLGPYKILREINSRAFELDLPKTSRLHRVFHVSQLEKYTKNPIPSRSHPPPPPVLITADDQAYYEVDRILDSRFYRSQLQYFIHWQGFGPHERTWEPASSLDPTPELKAEINEFHRLYPNKPGPVQKDGHQRHRGAMSCSTLHDSNTHY